MRSALVLLTTAALCSHAAIAAAQEGGGLSSLPWQEGPVTGALGATASVNVPERCLFLPEKDVPQFMAMTENPVGGNELGIIYCASGPEDTPDTWFVVFEWDESGYVKDDDKDELDADAIIKSIREGTEAANEERASRGWSTLTIEDWVERPYYDDLTKNLTWAIVARDDADQSRSVNHSVRLLGRRGVMSADLVSGPEEHSRAVPAFNNLISTFAFNTGHKYAEWVSGDKVASYGLTALVAGGAGVLAAKTGLFAKFWKVIAGAAIAAVAALKSLWARIRGDKSASATAR